MHVIVAKYPIMSLVDQYFLLYLVTVYINDSLQRIHVFFNLNQKQISLFLLFYKDQKYRHTDQ